MAKYPFHAIDELDAYVFSGPALEDDDFRLQLRHHIGRWTRALDSHADATCPHGEDWDDYPDCRH